jgi:hypothetical protein
MPAKHCTKIVLVVVVLVPSSRLGSEFRIATDEWCVYFLLSVCFSRAVRCNVLCSKFYVHLMSQERSFFMYIMRAHILLATNIRRLHMYKKKKTETTHQISGTMATCALTMPHKFHAADGRANHYSSCHLSGNSYQKASLDNKDVED